MTEPMMDRGSDVDSTAIPPKPEKSSLLDDFMDIFYAPSAVFARREKSSFWIPLLIVAALMGLIFFANRDLMEPIMDAEMTRAMAKSGQQMTEDQLKAARAVGGVIGTIGAFITAPFMIMFVGLITWLVGKFFDSKQTLNAALVVTAFAYVPKVVEGILMRVQGTLLDTANFTSRFSFSLGAGRFLNQDTTNPFVYGLLGRLDVFTIWVTVLLVIGLSVTGKIPRSRAAIAGVVIWLIGALPQFAQGLR